MSDVTRILEVMERGDPQAAHELLPLVYDELRKLAAARLAREKPGLTLDATALVHEAYVRLVGCGSQGAPAGCQFANHRHFFAAAAEAMRRILIELARHKRRIRHGGDFQRVELVADRVAASQQDERLLALDQALEQFAMVEPEKAELLKLRSFAGLSLDQAAAVLGISPSTADRWWSYARAWLRLAVSGENPE